MGTSWWKGKGLASWAMPLLLAETTVWDFQGLLWNIFRVVIYTFLALAIFAVCYLVIDKLTPFSFGRELLENKNTAFAIVLAGVFLGIAIILAAAIHG